MTFPLTEIAGLVSDLEKLEVLMAFAFGTFCAYWAQETRRNPWIWFLFGMLLPPVAGIVLLYRNAKRHPQHRNLAQPRNLDDPGSPELLAIHRNVP